MNIGTLPALHPIPSKNHYVNFGSNPNPLGCTQLHHTASPFYFQTHGDNKYDEDSFLKPAMNVRVWRFLSVHRRQHFLQHRDIGITSWASQSSDHSSHHRHNMLLSPSLPSPLPPPSLPSSLPISSRYPEHESWVWKNKNTQARSAFLLRVGKPPFVALMRIAVCTGHIERSSQCCQKRNSESE